MLREAERLLRQPVASVFDEVELDGLAEPVREMLGGAIAPGTPLVTSARLEMRGEIRLGRWRRFSGSEVLAPHAGFVWAVRVGPITGFDRYLGGAGEMRWRLIGVVPVMSARGPDVSRSAAGRIAGEAVWIPTALLPRFGVEWSTVNERHLVARLGLDAHLLELHYGLDDRARVERVWFDRWGDPDGSGTYGLHSFGVETRSWETFGGLTIPSAGRAGWHYGTDRWEDGVFFRYEITGLEPLGAR